MKMIKWLMVMALMASLVAVTGCGKGGSNAGNTQKTVDINGVAVAIPELQQSLMTSKDPTVQASAGKVAYGMRYGNYASVQEELAKLAADPNVTPDQKKLVAQVEDQLKQAIAKAPAPAQ